MAHLLPPRARHIVLAVCVLAQAVLLYAVSSPLASSGLLYGCLPGRGCAGAGFVPSLAALLGIIMFVLPSLIGALCLRWRAAISLAVAPWWLVVIVHGGTSLRPFIGLGGNGGSFGAVFWLDPTRTVALLLPLLLFAALGALGWLAATGLAPTPQE
ncbi:MAG: hypothetical protein ACHQ4H_14140 [Ktedonobacterales bacterium]